MIRAKVSERNKYWIEKHRFYELRHFCLQYPIWKKAYSAIDGLMKRPADIIRVQNSGISNPVEKAAESKDVFKSRMDLVEKAAFSADSVLGKYILEGVTNNYSYDILRARMSIPCCKKTYYDIYRRFFWILNKLRN